MVDGGGEEGSAGAGPLISSSLPSVVVTDVSINLDFFQSPNCTSVIVTKEINASEFKWGLKLLVHRWSTKF